MQEKTIKMLHLIIGLMNSGKTLYMTYKGYLDYKANRKIYSNYNLGYSHTLVNKEWIEETGKTGNIIENASLLIDESWIWWDSRASQKNRLFTQRMLQSSKGDEKCYLTSQNNNQQDTRIRNNAHLITTCERGLYINGGFKKITDTERILPLHIQKDLYIRAKTYSFKLMGMMKIPYLYSTELIKAQDIFKLYNTHNKIVSGEK